MKKINLLKVIIMITFGTIMTMIIMSSCTPNNASGNTPISNTLRIKVLKNNTINHLRIPNRLMTVYTYGDTVWVDLTRHVLDDKCDSAMRCVIESVPSR